MQLKERIKIEENEEGLEDLVVPEKPKFLSIYGSAPQRKNIMSRYSKGNNGRLSAMNHNSY